MTPREKKIVGCLLLFSAVTVRSVCLAVTGSAEQNT